MTLLDGLTPAAVAVEAGIIEVENHAMSTLLEYESLSKFQGLI